jgi:preprotein translocase subunit SecB
MGKMASRQFDEQEDMQSAQMGGQPMPLPFLPFEVQLQNVFATEIIAKQFPVQTDEPPEARLSIEDIGIDETTLEASAVLSVEVQFAEEPRPFAISFKLLGQFSCNSDLTPAQVHTFLKNGSLSILLPFARETLFSLCTRLQIPPIMLEMVKLVPPPPADEEDENQ